ncbi:hypothetical protein [Corynebacterium doosanense]|uniref:hypothetical protein n=1 Tax=Corynebacterium doosanense TaxID=1121358 RepID=UPI00158827A8
MPSSAARDDDVRVICGRDHNDSEGGLGERCGELVGVDSGGVKRDALAGALEHMEWSREHTVAIYAGDLIEVDARIIRSSSPTCASPSTRRCCAIFAPSTRPSRWSPR